MRAFAKDQEHLQKAMERDLLAAYRDLGRRAARAYRGKPPLAIRQIDPQDAQRVDAITRSMRVHDWQDTRMRRVYETHYLRTATATAHTIGVNMGLAVGLPDTVARKVVLEGGRRLGLVDLTGQTKRSMFHALSEGRAQGLGPNALAGLIRDTIPRGPWRSAQMRAYIVGRTETKYAQNVSSLELYSRMEDVTGMLAFDAQVGATDADCEMRDGVVYSQADAQTELGNEHPLGTLSFAPHVQRGRGGRPKPEKPPGGVPAPSHPLRSRPEPSVASRESIIKDITAQDNQLDWDEWLTHYADRRFGKQQVRLVNGSEFDSIDGPVILRGIAEKKHLASNLEGTHFGQGTFGNGQYYAGREGIKIARDFSRLSSSNEGWIYAAKLDPKARVISYDDLQALWSKKVPRMEGGGMRNFLKDSGRFAADEGFDAVYVAQRDYHLIVNNRALVVDRRSLPEQVLGKRELTPDQAIAQRIDELRDGMREAVKAGDRDTFYRFMAEVGDLEESLGGQLVAGPSDLSAIEEFIGRTYGLSFGG